MVRTMAWLLILGTTILAQAALTSQGGGFDANGNNTASLTLSPQSGSPSPGCTCPNLTVTVAYNSADGSTSVTVNSSSYHTGSGSISEVVTATSNGGGVHSTSASTLGGNTTPDARGNVSGKSNGEGVAAALAGSSTASITTTITYNFQTKVGDCTCTYRAVITVSQNPANGQATSASGSSGF